MNRKTTRLFIGILGICLVVSMLAGTTLAEKTTISYSVPGSEVELKEVYQPLIASFEKANPDIKVDLQFVSSGDYNQKITTQLAAGAAADAVYVPIELFQNFARKGVLTDLKPLINSTKFDIKDFYPVPLNAFKYQNRIYALPKDYTTFVIYYNKDLFDQAHLAYPNDQWTWKDFLNAAQKLTKHSSDGNDQYGFAMESWWGIWFSWIFQNGGAVMNANQTKVVMDNPKTVEAIRFIADLINKYKVAPSMDPSLQLHTSQLFETGRVGMTIYGRWMTPTFRNIKTFKWDVAVLPKGVKRASLLYTTGYGIPAASKHKKEAWKLITFLTGKPGATLNSELGQAIPAIQSIANSSAFLNPNLLPKNNQAFLTETSYSYLPPTIPEWPEISSIMSEQMDMVFLGQKSAKEACREITQRGNAILKNKSK